MPKNKIEQCTTIFIYRDLNGSKPNPYSKGKELDQNNCAA